MKNGNGKSGGIFSQDRDKLYLLMTFFTLCLLIIHFSHHTGTDNKALDFTLQAASGVLTSFIMLLQKTRVREREADEPPDTRSVTSRVVTVDTTDKVVTAPKVEKEIVP